MSLLWIYNLEMAKHNTTSTCSRTISFDALKDGKPKSVAPTLKNYLHCYSYSHRKERTSEEGGRDVVCSI